LTGRYKLLVIDVDGTLISKSGSISREDVEAISLASKNGVRVVLSTGRVVKACQTILDELQLDGLHIFFDGALVSNARTGEEIYVEPITSELVRETTAHARASGLNIDFFSSQQYYVEHENWTVDIRRAFFRLNVPVFVNFNDLSDRERLIKGTVIFRSDEDRLKARQLQQHFDGKLNFSWTKTPAYPDVTFINILSPRVSKGTALNVLCNTLGVAKAEVMSIGDGVNDISLLRESGLAVAMGNCAAELKSVAHYVTADVDHSGVAEAIKKYLL